MRTIALNGSSGFLGSQICNYFKRNYNIIRINREEYLIDPGVLAKKLEGADIVLNLAGARISLFSTNKHRKLMYDSRIETTRNLCRAIEGMKRPPELFISMSAVGIYDYEREHDEDSAVFGTDFLARLCVDWEEATRLIHFEGRQVIIRSGIVLSRDFGMLKQVLPMFKLGAGAILGNGNQALPFIHINDFLKAIDFIICHSLAGIINFVAPMHCTNKEFSLAIAKEVRKPLMFRVPAIILRATMGEQSAMILKGQCVVPKRLLNKGFVFDFPDIKAAVKDLN